MEGKLTSKQRRKQESLMTTTIKMPSAKETIFKAVELLDNENEELRNINSKIVAEMESLRRENERLRNELHISKSEQHELRNKLSVVEHDNVELQREYQIQTGNYEEERKICEDLHMKLKDGHSKFNKQIENLKNEIVQREASQKKAERELEALHGKLDRASRKNYSDRDIELLHEVEMLKNEKKDIETEKEDMSKENMKMKQELKNIKISFDEKESELRNENRRHSLLTKEFNSLLDENNRLKLQMRRRSNMQSLQSPSTDSFTEENISTMGRSSRKSQGGAANTSREPSLIINNEVFQPTKDYPLSSRERSNIRHAVPTGPSREPTLIKRSGTFGSMSNIKDTAGKRAMRQSITRCMDDSSSNNDSLPSLTRNSSSSQNSSRGKATNTWNV